MACGSFICQSIMKRYRKGLCVLIAICLQFLSLFKAFFQDSKSLKDCFECYFHFNQFSLKKSIPEPKFTLNEPQYFTDCHRYF